MASIQYFSSDERAGLALIGFSGLLSALSTLSLLTYIIWSAYLTKDHSGPASSHQGLRSFVQSSLGCYFLSLLLCDFIQGAAFTMNFEWSAKGVMKMGTACTIQGTVSQVGELGVTVWSFAISLHTFLLLFFIYKPSRLIAPTVLFLGWTAIVLLSTLGPTVVQTKKKGLFYGPTGAWCWVSAPYGTERLTFLYVWVFTALGSSIITYTLIYLRFTNIITINDNGKFQFQWRPKAVTLKVTHIGETVIHSTRRLFRKSSFEIPKCEWGAENGTTSSTTGNLDDSTVININTMTVSKDLKHVARRLMWYPILYGIVVIPVSICRMGVLAGWTPPFGLYLFAGICFAGSGVANSILFVITRHSFFKKMAQTGIHVTTQRVIMCADDAGNDVEFTQIQSHTSPITKSPVFTEIPFTAATPSLGTKEKSYASSTTSESDT